MKIIINIWKLMAFINMINKDKVITTLAGSYIKDLARQ